MYEIPQQLEYKEKIVFGLTFGQLFYAMLFFPLAFYLFFKLNARLEIRVFLTFIPVLLATGFMFFDLADKIKDGVGWFRLRKLKGNEIDEFFDIKKR